MAILVVGGMDALKMANADERWAIVRSVKNLDPSVRQVQALSPSWGLFKWYRQQEHEGKWDAAAFQNVYLPKFLHELKHGDDSKQAMAELNRLVAADRAGRTIAIGCFCDNERLCHRSIVAGLLQGVGCNVACENGGYERYWYMYNAV